MRVQVTKSVDVDDTIAEKMLSEFIDWLDERGMLRPLPDTMHSNINLVTEYMNQKEIG